MPLEYVVITAIIALAAAGISFFLGITYRKMVGEKEISSAEEEARRIINEAIKASEGKKREALEDDFAKLGELLGTRPANN